MKKIAMGWVVALAALAAPVAQADALAGLGLTTLPGGAFIAIPANASDFLGPGPRSITSGITWSSTAALSLFGYTGGYGIDSHGNWNGVPMLALNAGVGTMTIAFATPVRGVGAFMNYAPGWGDVPTIAAYDASHQLLESYVLNYPVVANAEFDVNAGEVHGFLRTNADIAYFTLAGSGIVATNLQVTPVPEPAAYAMLLAGLGVMATVVRRRRIGASR
jgi:hypothetical protein